MKREDGTRAMRAALDQDPVLSAYPTLCGYLADQSWDDGSERVTSTLLFFVEEARVKVCLNDRHNARSLWSSGKQVDTALESLECMLNTEEPDWKASRQRGLP